MASNSDPASTPAPAPVAAPAYTYSGDPSASPVDNVRFLLGDTGPDWLMPDGEIAYLLTQSGGNAYRAAMQACYALVAKFSRRANESVGGVSVQWTSLRDNFANLAEMLQMQQNKFGLKGRAYLTGSRRSDKQAIDSNPDRVSGQFRRVDATRRYLADTYRTGDCPWNNDWDKIP